MRKSTEDNIIKWHERGYTILEIHRIMPQCTLSEIRAVILNRNQFDDGARRR